MSIKKLIDNWITRRMFSKLVSEEVIKEIENNPNAFDISPHEGDYHYVLVQVVEGELERIIDLAGRVVDLATSHNAFVSSITASIVWCSYGKFRDSDASSLPQLVSDLSDQFGENVRFVFGKFHGSYGNIGCKSRFAYGPIFKDTTSILTELISLKYGEYKELEDV